MYIDGVKQLTYVVNANDASFIINNMKSDYSDDVKFYMDDGLLLNW